MITTQESLFQPFISVEKPENTLLPLAKCAAVVNNT